MSGTARGLDVFLEGAHVGYLVHYSSGANVFVFSETYLERGEARPVLGQAFVSYDIGDHRKQYVSRQKLPPFFSNLLPEGVLREIVAAAIKTHPENEFDLLAQLGANLPGAVRLGPAREMPSFLLQDHVAREYEKESVETFPFSLGGVQLKFSMFHHAGRFSMEKNGGEYIVKPPHPVYSRVPENEYVSMRLAQAAGLDVPETLLVPLSTMDEGLVRKFEFRRDEAYAYAIRRFDRDNSGRRIHAEDFAQVFDVHAAKKYSATNYDTMLRMLGTLSDGEGAIGEMVSRLVVNALLANGDAHLKNVGLIYPDGRMARLGPLYDVVSTAVYARQQETAALNLAGTKRFQDYNLALFQRVADRAYLSRDVVLRSVKETVQRAVETWPALLRELAPPSEMQKSLVGHWRTLHRDMAGDLVKTWRRSPLSPS